LRLAGKLEVPGGGDSAKAYRDEIALRLSAICGARLPIRHKAAVDADIGDWGGL
jgi:hypothetical protein